MGVVDGCQHGIGVGGDAFFELSRGEADGGGGQRVVRAELEGHALRPRRTSDKRRREPELLLGERAAGVDVEAGGHDDLELPQAPLQFVVDAGHPGARTVAQALFLLAGEEAAPCVDVGRGGGAEAEAGLRVLERVLDLDLERVMLVDVAPNLAGGWREREAGDGGQVGLREHVRRVLLEHDLVRLVTTRETRCDAHTLWA